MLELSAETINKAATLVGSLSVLLGIVVIIYKFWAKNKEQTAAINRMQNEQTLICYGVLCCLKGLKEQGCNGPVTEALGKIEKHLNQNAHTGI